MDTGIDDSPLLWYELGPGEVIQQIGGDWDRFALENGAPELVKDRVIGRSLWDFIGVPEVRMIYKDLFAAIRRTGRSVRFRFRCDSPSMRRLLVMVLTSGAGGSVRCLTRILEERPHDDSTGRMIYHIVENAPIVTVCSVCKDIRTPEGWVETHAALARHTYDLVEGARLSHGLCQECSRRLNEEIDQL